MMFSTFLASLHHFAAFTLVACLVFEWLTFRQTMPANDVRNLQRVDLWYGISALVLLIVGILRVVYGGKGYAFYTDNAVFWVKIALVIAASVLSIYPTIRYIKWGTQPDDAVLTLPDPEFTRIRFCLRVQVAGIVLILVAAPAMARGIRWF
jgi:putative membrane protein